MAFPGGNYAPPGVYTRTMFENPLSSTLEGLKIPVIVGEGNETLTQTDLEIVRGSSSTVDQRVVSEDQTGRAVVSISATGQVTLGSFNGVYDKIQTVNRPLVTGDGTGTTTTNRSDVTVTINGEAVVIRAVDGTRGIIQLATVPQAGDIVRCTYYFDRTDTQVTDDVSGQVPDRTAQVHAQTGLADVDAPASTGAVIYLHADIIGPGGGVSVPANNVLLLTVDGVSRTVTIPPKTNYTMAQIATAINAQNVGTLEASTFVNNEGLSTMLLQADSSLAINNGSATGILGFVTGQADNRVSTFYTYNGPITDGSGGGIVTTDPSHVVVRVNGRQVIPTAVDGSSRSVTLPSAPVADATVSIQYWWNTWQDTFDYLANINVTSVTRCGDVPGSTSYNQGADFVLQNDRIMWGTAAAVTAGTTTTGAEMLDSTQISLTLVDNRNFMGVCTPVVVSAGGISSDSRTQFSLPFQPTLGNGRDTPLGQSLFQTISNSRIDLPVNRPDVVWAYWGWDLQDAMNRGRVEVTKVDGLVITLGEVVPVGATVYAIQYYNTLVDAEYTLTCVTPGVSGVGQYNIATEDGDLVYNAGIIAGSKGAGLTGITLEFPSGSELTPDLRFESGSGDDFTGPVDEIVTVQFANRVASPAKYTVPGAGPYYFIHDESDRLRIVPHATELALTGLDLSSPSLVTAHAGGYFAQLVGSEVVYTGGTPAVLGQSYLISTSEEFTLQADGVQIPVKTGTSAGAAVDISFYSGKINEAAGGHQGVAAAGGAATITLAAASRSDVDNYYVGWRVVIGNGAAAATPGQVRTVTAYVGSTGIATVSANWAVAAVQANDPYYVYNPATRAAMVGATKFNGSTVILADKFDDILFLYVGNVSTSTTALTAAIAHATYATPADLATAVAAAIAVAVAAKVGAAPAFAGLVVECVANSEGQLEFRLQLPGVDSAGYLQFIVHGTPAKDFATLAGLDVAGSAGAGQAALIQGPIARTQECHATLSQYPYDRLVLRNRLLPGGANGSMSAEFVSSLVDLTVISGNTNAGLTTGAFGLGGSSCTVHPATMAGQVGFVGGQDTVTGVPIITIYDGSGTHPVNNVFSFEMDNVNVTTTFSLATGTATILLALAAPDTFVLKGVTFNAVNGVPDPSIQQFRDVAGSGSEAATATSLVAAINHADSQAAMMLQLPLGSGCFASSVGAVVTIIAAAPALGGGYTMVQTGGHITLSGASLVVDAENVALQLGPVASVGTIMYQVVEAMGSTPGAPWGTASAIRAANLVRQEGAGFRITSSLSSVQSKITIGSGSANSLLGFSAGQTAVRTPVQPKQIASALNSNRESTFGSWALDPSSSDTSFSSLALASTETDDAGAEYLYMQDAPTSGANLGAASSIAVRNTSPVLEDALFYGTGLNCVDGDGSVGDPALSGFFVTSSNPDGSGSINNSQLHQDPATFLSVGQDGIVGQTYRDEVTGLAFTILPRGWHDDMTGPWLAYPTGTTSIFRIRCSTTVTTDSNIPVNAIPGVEMKVANTQGVVATDTAIVETFERSGEEPAIGDLYYATYNYTKESFTTAFYTKMSAVEAAYGAAIPDNPASLGTYLSMINGAVLVGVKQVQKATGEGQASLTTYRSAISELEGVLPGQVTPDIIVLMRGDSTDLYQILKRSCAKMSSIRYKSERTAICGCSAGTLPSDVISMAQALSDTRMRVIYPDMVTITIQDNLGNTKEYLCDGTFLAAGLAGSVVSPNLDVATPWTGRKLLGYTQLARSMDSVQMNQIAVRGVTILENKSPFIRVRHGLTTDMTNILTKTPTVILIADEVQRQARNVLDSFIGIKFLPSVLSQIEGRLAMMFKGLVAAQIVSAYTGITANVSADDPTVAEVSAFYSPVWPLLYIVIQFNVRAQS